MLLPPARASAWLFVFLGSALVWTALLLLAGYLNTMSAPPPTVVATSAGVVSAAAAFLALLGFLGLRAMFVCTQVGLLVGYAAMLWTFLGTSEGMADLAAVATFLVSGAIGLGVGALVDLIRFVRRAKA